MGERYFTNADLPMLAGAPPESAYITSTAEPAGATKAGHMVDGLPVWNVPALDFGSAHAEYSGAGALTVVTRETVAANGLPLVFSQHLGQHRARKGQLRPPFVTSADAILPPQGHVRLPHLVGVRGGMSVHDTVVWETIPKDAAETLLDGELPDQLFFEQHLPELLGLRRMAREGTLGDTVAERSLDKLLAAGRYLSILFAYQHAEMLSEFITAKHDES